MLDRCVEWHAQERLEAEERCPRLLGGDRDVARWQLSWFAGTLWSWFVHPLRGPRVQKMIRRVSSVVLCRSVL